MLYHSIISSGSDFDGHICSTMFCSLKLFLETSLHILIIKAMALSICKVFQSVNNRFVLYI